MKRFVKTHTLLYLLLIIILMSLEYMNFREIIDNGYFL